MGSARLMEACGSPRFDRFDGATSLSGITSLDDDGAALTTMIALSVPEVVNPKSFAIRS